MPYTLDQLRKNAGSWAQAVGEDEKDTEKIKKFFEDLLAGPKSEETLKLVNALLKVDTELGDILDSLWTKDGDLEAVTKEFAEEDEEPEEEEEAQLPPGWEEAAKYVSAGVPLVFIVEAAKRFRNPRQAEKVLALAAADVARDAQNIELIKAEPAAVLEQIINAVRQIEAQRAAAGAPTPAPAPAPTPAAAPAPAPAAVAPAVTTPAAQPAAETEEERPARVGFLGRFQIPSFQRPQFSRKQIMVIGGLAVALLVMAIVGILIAGSQTGAVTGIPSLPTTAPAVRALEVPKPPPTPVPTTVPSTVATTCPGGYNVWYRFPSKEAIGKKGYPTLDMGTQASIGGPTLVEQQHYVTSVIGIADKIAVHTEVGAYYVPLSYFPPKSGEKQECVSREKVPGFDVLFGRIEPKTGAGGFTILDKVWFRWFGWLFIVFLVLGEVSEVFVKRRISTIGGIAAIAIFTYLLQPHVEVQAQWYLYALSLTAALLQGHRGAVKEVQEAIKRTKQVNLPDEVNELLEPGPGFRQLLATVDWSYAGVWAGVNIAWGVLTPIGSPLHQQFGAQLANLMLFAQGLLFYVLEAARRNRLGDWGSLGTAILGAVFTTLVALMLPRNTIEQTAAIVTATLATVVLIVIVGISAQKAIERDRIPDGLAAFGQFALFGLVMVAIIWP